MGARLGDAFLDQPGLLDSQPNWMPPLAGAERLAATRPAACPWPAV